MGQPLPLRASPQSSATSQELVCIIDKFPTQKLSYSPSGSFPETESCQSTYPSL